jgi:hypothetical protein
LSDPRAPPEVALRNTDGEIDQMDTQEEFLEAMRNEPDPDKRAAIDRSRLHWLTYGDQKERRLIGDVRDVAKPVEAVIPAKHREAANHYVKGAVIEVKHQDGRDVWLVTHQPMWQEEREYRVKIGTTAEEREARKMAEQITMKEGQIIAFSTGDYSSYQINCHMRVLVDFGTVEQGIAFMKSGRYEVDESAYGSTHRFIAWLQAKGLIEPIEPDEVIEWHIGDDYSLDL